MYRILGFVVWEEQNFGVFIQSENKDSKFILSVDFLQLNEYETDPYILLLSRHLTSNCFRISEDLHRFARNLQH